VKSTETPSKSSVSPSSCDVRLTGEARPLDEVVRLDGCFELGPLHEGRRARKPPIPAAVVEVQMRVDHRDRQLGKRPWVHDRPPLRVERRRRVDHPGVDEDRSSRGVDRPAEDRPALAVDRDVAEMKRTDVQSASAGAKPSRTFRSKTMFTAAKTTNA